MKTDIGKTVIYIGQLSYRIENIALQLILIFTNLKKNTYIYEYHAPQI